MPNPIKYSVTQEALSLKVGNFYFGTGDVPKGPTSVTGFYNGITPGTSGYTIYLDKASQGPAIFVPTSDSELVTTTNRIAGTSFTTADQSLNWFRGQTDKMVFNRDFDPLITNGLVLASDANFVASYPATGATWYDLGPSGYNGVLTNGPIYSNNSIFFDSTDDNVTFAGAPTYSSWTINIWHKANLTPTIVAQNIFNSYPSGVQPINSNEGALNLIISLFYNVTSIAVGPTGEIYVGGQFGGAQNNLRYAFVKLTSSGAIDTAFNAGFTEAGTNIASGEAFVFDSVGNLYISGITMGNMGTRRINPSTGALISQPLAGAGGGGPSLTYGGVLLDETAGKMWLYGHWATSYNGTSRQYITKVNITGYTLDTTFNSSTGFNSNEVYTAFLDSSKNLYLAGNFTQYKSTAASRIVKLNGITAAIDTSFAYGTGFDAVVNKIALTSGGKILAVGNFTSYNGTLVNRAVLLNTNGTIDATFSTGTGFNANVTAFDIQSDGKIIFVGNFTSYNGTSRDRIIRLDTNGSIDAGFNVGTGFTIATQTVKIQSDGKILIGANGTFSYNGVITTSGIVRLNSDGTLDSGFNIGTGIDIALYRDQSTGRLAGSVFQSFGIGTYYTASRVPPSYLFPVFNTYRMWTITLDSSKNIRFYLDGVQKISTTTTGLANMNMQMSALYPPGYPGQVVMYNRDLSATEVYQNYQNSFTRYLGPNIVTNGLSFYVDAAYPNSYLAAGISTSWFDIGGNNITGTLINGPVGATGGGGSILFDGTNDYADFGNVLATLTKITLEVWINCGTQLRDYNGILSKTASNTDGWEIRTGPSFTSTNTDLQFRFVGDNATTAIFNATNGVWYHVVATGEFGSQRFYVNGTLTDSKTRNFNTTVNTQPLSIGKLAYSPRYFKGNVAVARIYNRVLSATEVTQNYNAQKARFGY